MSIAISMTIITIAWLSSGSWLSISRSLAIISMVTIAISMTISISWLSSGSWLSISRSFAIISMVTIAISMTISKTISMSIAMAISMTIISISRLGNSHTQKGKRDSNQNVHVDSSSFSTTLSMV